MRPKTVSATSINSYNGCPMRYAAEQSSRVSVASAPGTFGTTLHTTLDKYIEKMYGEDGYLLPDLPAEHAPALLRDLWEAACAVYLGYNSEYVAEGEALLKQWVETRPLPHRVLSREVKETFDIEVPGYPGEFQAVTYILDRCDQLDDGSIEVIDYKSQYLDVSPDAMRQLVQPALYACAMRRKYGAHNVAVTFDMLRYQPVTIYFRDADMDAFERYLGNVIKRIWDDNEPREQLNSACRYCPRKAVCGTLLKADAIGWAPSMPPEELAAIHAQLKNAAKGIDALLKEIDEALLSEVAGSEYATVDLGDYVLGAKASTNTRYDPEVVLRVLGDDALPFLSVGKTALDKELGRKKGGRFSPEQSATIKNLAIVTKGDPHVTVTPKNPLEEAA